MIICPGCGVINSSDSKFCEKCGMKLSFNKSEKEGERKINFGIIKGLLTFCCGCILLLFIYIYQHFFWDLIKIFVDLPTSSIIVQFHTSFFYYILKIVFFGGVFVVLIWQSSIAWKKFKMKKFVINQFFWCFGLSLISISLLINGINSLILIIWNLGVQYEIVKKAQEKLLTLDPLDTFYPYYLHYSNFRMTTVYGSLSFGFFAFITIYFGILVLKKVLKDSKN
jgi:hypothetical protein